MKRIIFFLAFLLLCFSSVYSADGSAIRTMYYQAAGGREAAGKFLKVMELMPSGNDPVVLCYKGMAHLILANYSLNPYNKLAYFNKGREMLEKAIKSDPQNIEIRFMRFCVQTNAPFFLGYSGSIGADKALIISEWSKLPDEDLKLKIKNYLLETSHCTANEKSILK